MKNILIIIPYLKHGGGAEKSAVTIGNYLFEKGHQVKYLTFYDYEKKYSHKGEEICIKEKLSNNLLVKFFKLFSRAYHIKKICKKYNIHTTISFMEDVNFSNIISKLFLNKSKSIVSIRNSVDHFSKIEKIFVKSLYKYADYIVPIVKEEAYNLIYNYNLPSKKVINIYNTFNIGDINIYKTKEIIYKKELFTTNKFTFINIGRLVTQKDQSTLIQAFKKLSTKYQDIQLIILGEGEKRSKLEEIIGSNNNIHLLGNVDNPYQYLYSSDVYVSSSIHEGMSRVLIEALICGLPMISTDHKTGAKEILKKDITSFEPVSDITQAEYGILTPVGDIDKLYKSMEMMYLDKDLREKYTKLGPIRAKDFDVESIMREWEKII